MTFCPNLVSTTIANHTIMSVLSSVLSSQAQLKLVVILLLISISTLLLHPSNCQDEQIPSCPRPENSTTAHGGRGKSKHRHCGHCHLSVGHYKISCPQAEEIVANVTSELFKEAPVSAPATINLFFHDCFVDGCDASIMLATKPEGKELAERDAPVNKNLVPQGFDAVNKAKALVENICPGVVSCADILAIAARDFVHLAGGPYYEVKKGRWDGRISKSTRIKSNIPFPNTTVDNLIHLFASKGLSVADLVVLSGAHTIGFAHCEYLLNRIYSNNNYNVTDIDLKLLKELRLYCPPSGGNKGIVVPFDVETPFEFDNAYYANLQKNRGLLVTDQALFLDPRTRPVAETLIQDKDKFFKEFGLAMQKMGSIRVKLGPKHGEIRQDCTLRAVASS